MRKPLKQVLSLASRVKISSLPQCVPVWFEEHAWPLQISGQQRKQKPALLQR
jgi:hypothetical protein